VCVCVCVVSAQCVCVCVCSACNEFITNFIEQSVVSLKLFSDFLVFPLSLFS